MVKVILCYLGKDLNCLISYLMSRIIRFVGKSLMDLIMDSMNKVSKSLKNFILISLKHNNNEDELKNKLKLKSIKNQYYKINFILIKIQFF